eukprot:TRINITY_DN4334_c0_g1_i1.p1 TRINITY_DN4334_c0_g1~~TRINITY_DN4334_c0_g1_i1.p1  ORF type:complete len:248 (-),score=52.46 TRINITY_DN4334_c0_g1_i1:363-1106(-)
MNHSAPFVKVIIFSLISILIFFVLFRSSRKMDLEQNKTTELKFEAKAEKMSESKIKFTFEKRSAGEKQSKVSRKKAFHLLQQEDEEGRAFQQAFVSVLQNCEFEAYLWETPSSTIFQIEEELEFEFVLIDSPTLAAVVSDKQSFAEHLQHPSNPFAVSFKNLGGDATLIVPTDLHHNSYAHLAKFMRNAKIEQIFAFWKLVSKTYLEELDSTLKQLWLSTSGLGVYWLHVRIDTRPKYYQHQPYKKS